MLKLQFDTVPACTLAMEGSGILMLRQLLLFNDGAEPLEELRLVIALLPDLGKPLIVELRPYIVVSSSMHLIKPSLFPSD